MKVDVVVYLPLIVAIIGFAVWWLCTDSKAKAAMAKLGEVCLWAGMFAFLFAVATRLIHL